MLLFATLTSCITFGNGDFAWNSFCSNAGKLYSFEKIVIKNIQVDDKASISVSNSESDVLIKDCIFESVYSNFGSCCFWILSKTVDANNGCFSSLLTHYIDASGEGGSCLSLNSVYDAKIEHISISRISSATKDMFATIGVYDCNEKMRNINETNCNCLMRSGFVSGFFRNNSLTNNKFIVFLNVQGDYICSFEVSKKRSISEKVVFENCSASDSLILVTVNPLNIMSYVVKSCKGNVIHDIKGLAILEGWYSDKNLPSFILNTMLEVFDVPIEPGFCVAHFCISLKGTRRYSILISLSLLTIH